MTATEVLEAFERLLDRHDAVIAEYQDVVPRQQELIDLYCPRPAEPKAPKPSHLSLVQ